MGYLLVVTAELCVGYLSMETCHRCQSVLPRSAHLCQVCGTPVGGPAPRDARSAATWRSNESSRPATIDADAFLNDLLSADPRHADPRHADPRHADQSANGPRQDTTAVVAPMEAPAAPATPLADEAFDPSSWQTPQPASAREIQSQDPFSLPPEQLAAMAHQPAPPELPVEAEPLTGTDDFAAPWQSLAEETGFAAREPVASHDHSRLDWQEAGWDQTSHDAMHPRRTGHDGARALTDSEAYSPVPESTTTNPIDDLPTRVVPAMSNRVDADIRIGPHENHRMVSIGSAALALFVFLASTAAMLFTETGNNALTASAASGRPSEEELAYTADPEAVLADLTPGLVQVTLTGCSGVPTVYGAAMVTQSDIVIVPMASNPESAEVLVSTAAGEVTGRVVGWGLNERMALVQLPSLLATKPLVWGSANRLAQNSELTLVSLQAGVWTASPARTGSVVRNRDGVYSNVNLADGALVEGAFAISEGNIVGLIKPSEATSVVTADVLRSAVGRMLLDPTWTPTPCVVDPASTTTTPSTTAPAGG